MLQDRVPAFSNKEAFAVVESELGVPFEDVYELVEPEPIAAASIGQVRTPVPSYLFLVLHSTCRGKRVRAAQTEHCTWCCVFPAASHPYEG